MTENKWLEIKGEIKERFKVLEEESKKENEERRETIIFEGPVGKTKLEWVERPKFLDIKTRYSRRAGTHATIVGKVTSKEEKVSFIKVYVFKDSEWMEIEADKLNF